MRTFSISSLKEAIRPIGRVLADPSGERVYIDWSLSGIEFRYTGRVLTAHFTAESGQEPSGAVIPDGTVFWTVWPRFAVYIDDEKMPHRVFTVDKPDKDEIIFSSDKKEDHTIRIVKLTENLKTGAAVDSFFGDGQILACRHTKKPVIEFIGDSVTCGFGNLGTLASPGFFSEEEDPTQAYAAVAASELGMDFSIIGFSGICAGFKDWNRKPYSMLDLYDYTNVIREDRLGNKDPERWDFKHHRPDYIVINLGTNDADAIAFTGDRDGMEKKFDRYYYELISKVRENNGIYPKIICAMGDMRYYLYDNVVRAAQRYCAEHSDRKIYTLKLRNYSPQKARRGAVDHPGVDSALEMGMQLAAFIREIE